MRYIERFTRNDAIGFALWLTVVVFVLLTLSEAQLQRYSAAEAKHARAELAAYEHDLNACQDKLTQRGNEIAQCVDDNEEMANRLAQGIRCPRAK